MVFDLWPELRPDPRSELGSDASVVAVERNVTRDEYLRRRYPSPSDYQRRRREEIAQAQGQVAGLRIHGELAYVRVKLHGYKGSRVVVRWSIYDARRQTRITQAKSESRWTGDAPTDRFIDEIWLEPAFGSHRRYFVRIEVREPHGVLLAMADSEPFTGLDA